MRQYLPLALTSKYMPAPSAYLSPVALPLCLVLFLMNVSFSATVPPLTVSGLAVFGYTARSTVKRRRCHDAA